MNNLLSAEKKYATAAEMVVRINIVKRFIIDGIGRSEIIRKCADLWDIKEDRVDQMMRRARTQIDLEDRAIGMCTREFFYAEWVKIYQAAESTEDKRKILRDLAEACGVFKREDDDGVINVYINTDWESKNTEEIGPGEDQDAADE